MFRALNSLSSPGLNPACCDWSDRDGGNDSSMTNMLQCGILAVLADLLSGNGNQSNDPLSLLYGNNCQQNAQTSTGSSSDQTFTGSTSSQTSTGTSNGANVVDIDDFTDLTEDPCNTGTATESHGFETYATLLNSDPSANVECEDVSDGQGNLDPTKIANNLNQIAQNPSSTQAVNLSMAEDVTPQELTQLYDQDTGTNVQITTSNVNQYKSQLEQMVENDSSDYPDVGAVMQGIDADEAAGVNVCVAAGNDPGDINLLSLTNATTIGGTGDSFCENSLIATHEPGVFDVSYQNGNTGIYDGTSFATPWYIGQLLDSQQQTA